MASSEAAPAGPASGRPEQADPAAAGPPMSGRRAQAARNNELILQAARAVFLADPDAPITAVAKQAGVGISALYTRYASKDDLLRKLCRDGLTLFLQETERALADPRDPWSVLSTWMGRLVDADTSSLTAALAGKFSPTPEMFELGERANQLSTAVFDRVRSVLRRDVDVHDLSVILELVAGLKVKDPDRTRLLRRRYLALILDGMRDQDSDPLPGPAPSWPEINERWVP